MLKIRHMGLQTPSMNDHSSNHLAADTDGSGGGRDSGKSRCNLPRPRDENSVAEAVMPFVEIAVDDHPRLFDEKSGAGVVEHVKRFAEWGADDQPRLFDETSAAGEVGPGLKGLAIPTFFPR